jgi:hypothetical protein
MPKQRIEALRTQVSLALPNLALQLGHVSLDFEVEATSPRGIPGDEGVIFRLSDLDVPPRPLRIS